MLNPLPNQGLEANFTEYLPLHLRNRDDRFLDPLNQNVIRSDGLSRLLAHADAQPRGLKAVFSHTAGGRERASDSTTIRPRKRCVPISEIDLLESGVRSLIALADLPSLTPTSKQLIEEFRLPDPDCEPEMYRLYGYPWNRKLLVLWGCERHAGSSLPPLEAVSRLRSLSQPNWWIWLVRLLWLGALLAFLLWLFAKPAIDSVPSPVLPSGTSSNGASSDGTSSDGTSSDGASSDGTSSDGTSSDGTSSDGTSSDGTSSDGTASDGASTSSTSSDGTSPGNTSSGNTSSGNTSSGNTSSGKTSSGNTSSGNTSSGNTSSGKTSSGKTSSGKTSSGKTSSGKTSSGKTSSGKTSSGNTSTGNTSTGNTSTKKTPAATVPKKLVLQKFSEDKPTGNTQQFILRAFLDSDRSVALKNVEWTVDGTPQRTPGNERQLTLPNGDYDIEVTASHQNQPLKTKAKLQVRINQTGSVTLIPIE